MINLFPRNCLVLPQIWMDRFKGRDPFEQIFALEGKVYREHEGRKTLRFTFDGKGYFVKLYRGVGWREIMKNLFHFSLPVTSAQIEWEAIKRLEKLGVRTMPLVGYGKNGRNPARIRSFVITEELDDTISLENFCRPWPSSPPPFVLKRALIMEVARIARKLHNQGMNHRDLYICHFLLNVPPRPERVEVGNLLLYLIDLNRMQTRRRTLKRRRVKDIAALYFSSMDIGLTKSDLLRFIHVYADKPLRASLKQDRNFWSHVGKRAVRLYRKVHGKDPRIAI